MWKYFFRVWNFSRTIKTPQTAFTKKKLDRCNAKFYDLTSEVNNIRVSKADFKMFKECNLAYKLLKSNPNIVILKADKDTSFVILNKPEYFNKMKAVLNDKTKF